MVLDGYKGRNIKKDVTVAKKHDKIKIKQWRTTEQDRASAALIRDNQVSYAQLMVQLHVARHGHGCGCTSVFS